MEQMSLTQEQQDLMDKEISPIVELAESLTIKTQDDSNRAQTNLKEIKRRRAMIHEKFDPPVRAAHKAWQAAKSLYNYFVNPFDEAETIIKRKVVTFESEQGRRRQEEARIAEAKRQEAERKEREKLEAQAKAAEEKGKSEKAEALREKAENVTIAPAFTPPAAPKVEGASFKKVWKGEVTDLLALCKAIAEGRAPANLISINQTALNAFAKGVKDTMAVPGLKFFEDTEMAVRA